MFTVEIQIFPLATVRLIGNTACFISINVIQRFAQEDVLLTVGTVQDFLYIAIQLRNLILVERDVSIYVPGKVCIGVALIVASKPLFFTEPMFSHVSL